MSVEHCNVKNEHNQLKAVVVGTAESWGPNPTPEEAIDPKSREHILAGTYPIESDVKEELEALAEILKSEGVTVYRPEVVNDLNQVFARDVGVVIDDKLVRTSMIADRAPEWEGISPIFTNLPEGNILTPPDGVRVGVVMLCPWVMRFGLELEMQKTLTFIKRLGPTSRLLFGLRKCSPTKLSATLHYLNLILTLDSMLFTSTAA